MLRDMQSQRDIPSDRQIDIVEAELGVLLALVLMGCFRSDTNKPVVILGFATCEIQYQAGRDPVSSKPTGKL